LGLAALRLVRHASSSRSMVLRTIPHRPARSNRQHAGLWTTVSKTE
jgi:hypothetical protein